METYKIDCAAIPTREAMHRSLAETLRFPAWYGHNLDALYDCLMELDEPTQLRLLNWQDLPDWKIGFTEVFAQAGLENPNLTIIL